MEWAFNINNNYKKMKYPYLKNESLDYQSTDFTWYVYTVLEAFAKGHKKYLGFDLMVSEKMQMEIKKDILDSGIQFGRYAIELRDYLINRGEII